MSDRELVNVVFRGSGVHLEVGHVALERHHDVVELGIGVFDKVVESRRHVMQALDVAGYVVHGWWR